MTIAAVATLQGIEKFVNSIFQSQRLVNTVLYLISLCISIPLLLFIGMTILFSLVKRNYIGTIVSSIFQVDFLFRLYVDDYVRCICDWIYSFWRCGCKRYAIVDIYNEFWRV